MDDGSGDNTAALIAEYSDPRLRYFWQKNRGPFALAETYNYALSMSHGSIVAILEGDDFWPDSKLELMVRAFDDREVVLAYGEVVDVDANGFRQRNPSTTALRRKKLSASILNNAPSGTATHYMLLAEGRSLVSPASVVIRRSVLESIGGFQCVSGLPLIDYPTFMELSLNGRFQYSPNILGYRRRHEASITANYSQHIHSSVSAFALDFLLRHRDRIAVSEEDLRMIERNWRHSEGKVYFSEGRSLLLQKRWNQARKQFCAAVAKTGEISTLAAAIMGILATFIHCDIEFIMQLVGRASLISKPLKTSINSLLLLSLLNC